ncbi:MAG: hypothetical protein ABW094_16250 [Candidatus Thiodiazotropha sp.]
MNPDTDAPYDKLKAALLQRTAISEEKRLNQVLNDLQLGDQTPSQFLRRMRQAAEGCRFDDKLLRHLWMQRLPENIQAIISPFVETSALDDLASSADKVAERLYSSSITHIAASPTPNSELADLLREVKSLRLEVQNIKAARNRDRSTSGKRRSSSRHSTNPPGICWYHQNFGNKAKRCNPPCSFNKQGNDNTSN